MDGLKHSVINVQLDLNIKDGKKVLQEPDILKFDFKLKMAELDL